MNELYNQLITKTFCDNAIRTVTMIDDEYLPYTKMIKMINDGVSIEDLKGRLGISSQASLLQRFFEKKKMICDISDGITDFDAEKIRKSDLIILDYELSPRDPTDSLQILNKLAQSPHMNMVVIYTNMPLETVWLQIATTLSLKERQENQLSIPKEIEEYWNDQTEDGDEIPERWKLYTNEDLADFIIGDNKARGFAKKIAPEIERKYVKWGKEIASNILYREVEEYCFDIGCDSKYITQGAFSQVKWFRASNVFIALHSKSVEGDDAESIWKTLNSALCDWKPSYFRLIASEIQNNIENFGIALDKFSDADEFAQIGWLWQALQSGNDVTEKIKEILINSSDSIRDRVILKDDTISFSKEVFSVFSPLFPNDKSSKDQIIHAAKLFDEKIKVDSNKTPAKVVHALNRVLSTKDFTAGYITTGTIIKSIEGYYMCVSPACDTVPAQNNNCLSKRLAPNHKSIKLIKLQNIKSSSALYNATEGNYFFLNDEVTLQVGSSPNIDYVVSKNKPDERGQFLVTSLKLDGEQVVTSQAFFEVVGQLKESYAARFQAAASHHVGRIGVDFISYKIDDKA